MYVRYVQIFRQLEVAYDQIVHPQKMRAIRGILDGVMGRVLELKNEMVEKEFSEYHYMDDVIQDLKLTPADIEIPIPRYFANERGNILSERNMAIYSAIGKVERNKAPGPQALKLEEAIKIIQVSERARQGRLRARFMREIQRDEERQQKAKDSELGPAAFDQAAVCIQKVWKGFVQRKKTKWEREEEMIFLGMAMGPRHFQPCATVAAADAIEQRRRQKQREHEDDYQKATVSVTGLLRESEGPDMKETLKDQIRQWFFECRDATGSFPEYPEEEDGGSAIIFAEKTPQQLMDELAAKEEEDASKAPKGKEERMDKGKKDKGKGEEEEEEPGLKMLPSAFLKDLEAAHKSYAETWENRNEDGNFSQRHDMELIKEEKRKELETEIRKQVDELMRQELAHWRLAVDKDKGGKAKGSPKKKKGTKSGKKKKKEKDLTSFRTVESLYQELVKEGLLKKAEDIKLQDYLGDYSYLGTTLRQNDIEPMPSLSDVRQLITLYAIVPLGSQAVHENAPLVKAILLVGPAGVGKKMLVHAICRETGANLFNLSPLNLVGKYPGRNGLQMMVHMVFKVAKIMQPSVVWIGDAEKMFYKKVPKEEKEVNIISSANHGFWVTSEQMFFLQLDPKRLKKDLPKAMKAIKPGDRVLVIGTTREPFHADLKSICKVFSKIVLIPRPDYASRFVMWRELIVRNGGEMSSALDISSLAKISDGYTQGQMVEVVRGLLTERRLQQLQRRPLTAAEFVSPLAKMDPVFQAEEEALKDWYAKTPMGRKRVKAASGKEGEDEPPVKAGKDGKKKGKK
uniref:ATPase AAA-type core domain-containing protein n=1 Tax=Denticeps clupeoides TaxID=299321 RepID=A0AAY4BCR0_9TELE